MHGGSSTRAGTSNKRDTSNSFIGQTNNRDKTKGNDYDDDSSDDLASAQPQKRGRKRHNASSLQELEDTDDEEDDNLWLNASSISSSPTQWKRK